MVYLNKAWFETFQATSPFVDCKQPYGSCTALTAMLRRCPAARL